MSILERLTALFRRRRSPGQVSLDVFSLLPLYQMTRNDAPFDDWRPADTVIAIENEVAFKMFVWVYQFYIFYILTAKRFGSELADAALQLQVDAMDRGGSSEIGRQIAIGVRQIERAAGEWTDAPSTFVIGGEERPVPWEIQLATSLLVGQNVVMNRLERSDLPDKETICGLAECLIQGRDSAVAFFEPLVSAALLNP